MAKPTNPSTDVYTVDDVVCLGCACLCDDLRATVRDDRIIRLEPPCPGAATWLHAGDDSSSDGPLASVAATIAGEPADIATAIERAAEILVAARAPVVAGFVRTTWEADREAVAIADRLGAVVDVHGRLQAAAGVRALQQAGLSTCTLGEVRQRADLLIIWGANPMVTHPRFLERFGPNAPGRETPCHCIVIDDEPTATSAVADDFLAVSPAAQFESIHVVRALLQGIPLSAEIVFAQTGVSLAKWQALAERITAARYGAIVWGEALMVAAPDAGFALHVESLAHLVRDRNVDQRFVLIALPESVGPGSAEDLLAWQTGYPAAVDFSQCAPRGGPGQWHVDLLRESGELDVELLIGENIAQAETDLSDVPRIIVGPSPARGAAVWIGTTRSGVESGGTLTRLDEVPLLLNPPLAAGFSNFGKNARPSMAEALAALHSAIEQRGTA